MAVYSVSGVTVVTAAAINNGIAALWNPSTTRRIKVLEAGVYKNGITGIRVRLTRVSARGTPGSTVTPDADNSWEGGDDVPASGALLDLAAYTVQPTIMGTSLNSSLTSNASGSGGTGYVWTSPEGWWVPPLRGFAILTLQANAWPISEVYFVWEED